MAPKISTKERLAIPRQAMPERGAAGRSRDFIEVNLGFTEQIALLEAQRCLQCIEAKCIAGCPVMVDIPRFIRLIVEGDLAAAAESLRSDNALPAVTGRVCPQETQCEIECVRGVKSTPVAIGHLERFVADWASQREPRAATAGTPPGGRKIAVVGSGPAGLTAAGELVKLGHDVTIYEALHQPGGVLVYGIPEFRLPKKIVDEEVGRLKQAGVKIECNVVIGRTYTLNELRARFAAVFIANGAGLPVFMSVPGENLKGVYSANEYLTRVNLMGAYEFPRTDTPILRGSRVAVVGGGNVAMDAARTAKRLGAGESMIVYRRTLREMPARVEEVHHAEQEGVRFELLVAPVEVLGDPQRWVTGLKCIRASPTPRDGAARCPSPARSLSSIAISLSWRLAPALIRSSPPPAPSSSSTAAGTSRWPPTARPACRACLRAATSREARLR